MNVSSLELDQQDARFMIGVDHAKLCKVSAQTSQDNTWGVTYTIMFLVGLELCKFTGLCISHRFGMIVSTDR
jgi:hypothetical protein